VAIVSNMFRWHMNKAINKDRQAFVDSLPVVDVATILPGDMRCAHCWCDFDEANGEGRDNTPVRAPYPHGYLFGKNCLKGIMFSMGLKMLCPVCRQEWNMTRLG
jgi:hypothetical protein